MADCMKLAEKALYTLLLDSVGRAVSAGTLPAEPMNAFRIEVPADKSHGDFATNIAMVNAKEVSFTSVMVSLVTGGRTLLIT